MYLECIRLPAYVYGISPPLISDSQWKNRSSWKTLSSFWGSERLAVENLEGKPSLQDVLVVPPTAAKSYAELLQQYAFLGAVDSAIHHDRVHIPVEISCARRTAIFLLSDPLCSGLKSPQVKGTESMWRSSSPNLPVASSWPVQGAQSSQKQQQQLHLLTWSLHEV